MRVLLLLSLVLGLIGSAWGQYMSLNITAPYECGAMTVQWWGDDGPYHLLITPTEIRQHSYNVWVPTIDNGTNTYTMTLRQPEGLPFMVTVWGKSGIQFAGSSDIYTVGPPSTTTTTTATSSSSAASNSSCFLTDQEILDRYSFSFNITGSRGGWPPQCSNLTMSWPTSLEQSVLGTIERRDFTAPELLTIDGADPDLEPVERSLYPPRSLIDSPALRKRQNSESNPSSSSDKGNTTNPPTMFGLIPLGNSFSLPITYAANSSFANSLPESSVSSEPTTFTRQGVTYLNWTLPLAKGTRFILVAGIGSAEQWASGGSSRLMTVAQGNELCLSQNQDDGPSVTADSSNTDAIPTATRPPDDGSTPNPPDKQGQSNLVRVVLACVISIVGTLVLVLAFWFWRRLKRQRAAAASLPGKKGRVDPYDPNIRDSTMTGDTQLDLLGRDGLRLDTSGSVGGGNIMLNSSPTSPIGSRGGPSSPNDPFSTPIESRQFSYPYPPHAGGGGGGQGPSRSSTLDNMSPLGMGSTIGRQSSQEALLSHGTATTTPTMRSQATSRRLALNEGFEEEEGQEEESSDLKRETLAVLEGRQSPGPNSSAGWGSGQATRNGTPTGNRRSRRRPDEDVETEYVVHRDAGRVDRVELPPRYDEVQWDQR